MELEQPSSLSDLSAEQLRELTGRLLVEVRHKQGLASADQFTCAVDSQVRAGGETGRPVRTSLSSSPTGDAIGVGVFLSQCLEAHARDINQAAAATR